MKVSYLIPVCLIAIMMYSCATPQVAYMADVSNGVSTEVSQVKEIRIRPGDKISILVNSKDPALVDLFNLPIVSRQVGNVSSFSTPQGISGYTVDSEGEIDFPVLGKIRVSGKTREEIAWSIKEELIVRDQVKDPVVTVEFMNLTISVLGEVVHPGRFNIEKDQLTILEALSQAGDLTIYGKRENVKVQREEGTKRVTYEVDLTSAEDLYASPVYYLQQNDVVYVEPNSMRARQATVNGNNVRSTSFWISLVSLLTTITTLLLVNVK